MDGEVSENFINGSSLGIIISPSLMPPLDSIGIPAKMDYPNQQPPLCYHQETNTGYKLVASTNWSEHSDSTNSGLVCTLDNKTALNGLDILQHETLKWTPEITQRIVTLAIIMTFTFFGNVIIMSVLTCSRYRKISSRVNIFIVNLAIGDLTVLVFTMTTEVLFVVFEHRWLLGGAMCKILLYIQIVTLASTTFILTAMSYDRYLALCRPMTLHGNLHAHARRLIIVCWILAFIFAIPQLLIFKQVPVGVFPDGEVVYGCKSRGYTAWWQRKIYFTFLATYILVIPTIIISYCYINVVRAVWRHDQGVITDKDGNSIRRERKSKSIPKAKIRTIKMTLCIICLFIVCWTPYFVVHLIHIWSEYTYHIPERVYVFAETIALLNSAINPILYGCFNIKIKSGLMEVFCPHKVRKKRSIKLQCMMSEYLSEARTPSIRNGTKPNKFDFETNMRKLSLASQFSQTSQKQYGHHYIRKQNSMKTYLQTARTEHNVVDNNQANSEYKLKVRFVKGKGIVGLVKKEKKGSCLSW